MECVGRSSIIGVKGEIMLYGISFLGSLSIHHAGFTNSFTRVDLKDYDGNFAGSKISNRMATAVLEMVPIGGTQINTVYAAATTIQEPEPFGIIRLFNFLSPQINGYWNYSGGMSVSFDKWAWCVLTLPIERHTGLDARNVAIRIK